MYQEWCAKPALVEMPTLTVSTGIAQGSAKGSVESISLSYFRGSIMRRGIDMSLIDFFYNLQLAFVRSFLFFYILMFERFRYSNTLLINQSLDIPFLNHSIFPETSLHPRITHDLFPSFFILLHFIVREISVWAHDCPTI
jgi:hypothetical protein